MVVDTMVVAYALLGFAGRHRESMAVLRAAEEILAPDLLRAELMSALWQWTRSRRLPAETAGPLLEDGERLVDLYVPMAEIRGLAWSLALARDHSPYDTLFVATAALYRTPLVTYDARVLEKFPEWAVSPAGFLASRAARG
jgi:predicted nucleic acid-binding protein